MTEGLKCTFSNLTLSGDEARDVIGVLKLSCRANAGGSHGEYAVPPDITGVSGYAGGERDSIRLIGDDSMSSSFGNS
jgi:hypothetical protein